MTSIHTIRRVAGILAIGLALAITAASASARPNDLDAQGSSVQPPALNTPAPSGSSASPSTLSRAARGKGGELTYLAVGGGVAALMVLGIGATVAIQRRRHRRQPAPPSVRCPDVATQRHA